MILPSGDAVLQDGASTTGVQNYKEFWYTMVGFAGEAQGFDGNGTYVRTATGGGDILDQDAASSDRRRAATSSSGTRCCRRSARGPKRPSNQPPYKTERRLLQEPEAEPQRPGGRPPGHRTRWAA